MAGSFSESRQFHTGEDAYQSIRKGQSSGHKASQSSRTSTSVKAAGSRAKAQAVKTGTRIEEQKTGVRQTLQTKEAATARTTRTTPETESVTTTYGHVGVTFTLSIKIQLGGQPTMVTIPPLA